MLDCSTTAELLNRVHPLDNGDMHKGPPECHKKNSGTDVAAATAVLAAAEPRPPAGPSTERPKIDKSSKFFHIPDTEASYSALESREADVEWNKRIAEEHCASAETTTRSRLRLGGTRADGDEETELYNRSLTSASHTISSQTTDDEYRLVPKFSAQVHKTGSRYTLVPIAPPASSSDEEDPASDTRSRIVSAVARDLHPDPYSGSLQLIGNDVRLEQLPCDVCYDGSEPTATTSERLLRMRNASYPELNTLQEMAFIEWNVLQNDMLKNRGSCVL